MIADLMETWRDWRARRRRSQRRLADLCAADVVMVSRAKSGRTWVRAMLSHLYHLEFGTPADEIVSGDNLKKLDTRIPAIHFTHISDEPPRVRRAIEGGALSGRKLVGLVRDPRDVVASHYHHYRNRSSTEKRRRRGTPERPVHATPFDFACDEQVGMPLVLEGMNRLKTLGDAHPDFSLFRYEDFRAGPQRELARLARALGHDFPASHIAAAVEFASFANLRRREREGFFRSGILRPGDPRNPDSFKVRRGKVGGYKEEFSPEERRVLDRMIDDRLVTGFGYRTGERVRERMAQEA